MKKTTNYDFKKNDSEIQKRISICLEYLIEGLTPKEIFIQNDVVSWSVSERQIERYLEKAKEQIQKETNVKHSYLIAIASARYDNIYKKCMEIGNYKEALNAVNNQAKLFGLIQSNTYINQNIQNNNNNQQDYGIGNLVSSNDELIKLTEEFSMKMANLIDDTNNYSRN